MFLFPIPGSANVWVPQSCLHIVLCVCVPAVGKRRVAPKIRLSGCDVHFVTCSCLDYLFFVT